MSEPAEQAASRKRTVDVAAAVNQPAASLMHDESPSKRAKAAQTMAPPAPASLAHTPEREDGVSQQQPSADELRTAAEWVQHVILHLALPEDDIAAQAALLHSFAHAPPGVDRVDLDGWYAKDANNELDADQSYRLLSMHAWFQSNGKCGRQESEEWRWTAPPAPSVAVAQSVAGCCCAVVASPLSIAQRCDQDSLSIILSFSERFIDVVSAARTCRSWHAAAIRRPSSCRATHRYPDRGTFLRMLQSPLHVHLSGLTVYEAISGEELWQLSARCPQLEQLDVQLDRASVTTMTRSTADAAAFNAQAWPSSLRELRISVSRGSQLGLQPLIDALPFSAVGLRSLALAGTAATIDLAPLLQLLQLRSLRIDRSLSPSQLAVVKQLRRLTALDLVGGDWERKDLLALLADGTHQLQRLEIINIGGVELDVELMQALLTLPSLTELEPCGVETPCFPLLRSFVKLRTLQMTPLAVDDGVLAAELLSSLGVLSELTSLTLGGATVECEAQKVLVDGLGAAVPQLRELRLHHFGALPLLLALSACTQLRTLCLIDCGRARGHSIDDVLQLLPSLRHLDCFQVLGCGIPLTDTQRAQLIPPSVLAPALKIFYWRER